MSRHLHPLPSTRLARPRRAGPLAVVVAIVALLASCGGERPSLEPLAATTTVAGSSAPATTTTLPRALALGPDTLLGFIATPVGAPIVHAEPSTTSATLPVPATTPVGAPTTFAVVGEPRPGTDRWYQVALADRPNESTGWVPADSVTVTRTPYRVTVDLAARTMEVRRDQTVVLTASIAIGTTENPTPTGAAFVTELVESVPSNGSYGPYAFGLSLHSDTLSEFGEGGDGQVGIHGTNRPSLIGQAVSHGCVRLRNEDIKAMVDLDLPLGVPVFIT